MKIGLWFALVTAILQVFSGDKSGKVVARYQPAKLAALEALYQTKEGAPLTLFGIVNSKEEKLDYAVQVPKLLSFVSFNDFDATIKGLDQFPKEDWPNVVSLFNVYRLMLGMWGLMFLLSLIGIYLWFKKRLEEHPWILRIMVLSVIFPQLANQAGWYCAESGRFPWIVYGLLRISDGLSKAVTANQVLGSIIMFSFLYFILFLLFIYLLNEKIKHGPEGSEEDSSTPYHELQHLIEQNTHDTIHKS
jgi:cytochrome d ubiquinol oxidase subunit I